MNTKETCNENKEYKLEIVLNRDTVDKIKMHLIRYMDKYSVNSTMALLFNGPMSLNNEDAVEFSDACMVVTDGLIDYSLFLKGCDEYNNAALIRVDKVLGELKFLDTELVVH